MNAHTAEDRVTETQGKRTGAEIFLDGVVAGSFIFHSGMIEGAKRMLVSKDPAKTLHELREAVLPGVPELEMPENVPLFPNPFGAAVG